MNLEVLPIAKRIKEDELEYRQWCADIETKIFGYSTIAVHSDTKTVHKSLINKSV